MMSKRTFFPFRSFAIVFYTADLCVYSEWLDESVFIGQSSKLQKLSLDVQQLKNQQRTARRDDISQIETFLGRLEQQVKTRLNSSIQELSNKMSSLVSLFTQFQAKLSDLK